MSPYIYMLPIGLNINGLFTLFDSENKLKIKPLRQNEIIHLELYQGLFNECSKNICIFNFPMVYSELLILELLIHKNTCQIRCKEHNYLSHYIDYISEDIENAHKIYYQQNKINDEQWKNHKLAKNEYEEYIQQYKSTLYDDHVKYLIEQCYQGFDTYGHLMAKFERAEQLCYIEDISIDEYKLAMNEIDYFIKPIMNIITKNKST